MIVVVGIDGGLQGALVAINEREEILTLCPMPVFKGKKSNYDLRGIAIFFSELKQKYNDALIKVFMEEITPIGINSKKTFKSLGRCQGLFEGFLWASGISCEFVLAQVWQAKVFSGMTLADTKAKSVIFCQRKYPNTDFRTTEQCKKISDGLTDATCIAIYGLRKLKGEGIYSFNNQ